MQGARHAQEKEDIEKLAYPAMGYQGRGASHEAIDNIDPIELGFVCSKHTWQRRCPQKPKSRLTGNRPG